MASTDIGVDLGKYQLGWSDEEDYVFKPKKGLNREILQEMSWLKGEPQWMLDFRLKSFQRFERRPMPGWGGDMSDIDFDDIYYYIKPTEQLRSTTGTRSAGVASRTPTKSSGIPEAERKYLAGVTAQYESPRWCSTETARTLSEQGVIFTDMDTRSCATTRSW